MVANSRMNYKSETMLKVIRDLVLHSALYFATVWKSTLSM